MAQKGTIENDGARGSVRVELSNGEALVLFEFLSRESDSIKTAHPSERKVVLKILGGLEESLAQPFVSDYEVALSKARVAVQGQDEA